MLHRIGVWNEAGTRGPQESMITALVHTRNPARTWRTFGLACMITMLDLDGRAPCCSTSPS